MYDEIFNKGSEVLRRSTEVLYKLCKGLMKMKLTALPFALLKLREDLVAFHSVDNTSLLKLAVLTEVEPIVYFYTDLSEIQLSKLAKIWDGDTLLHLAARNQ